MHIFWCAKHLWFTGHFGLGCTFGFLGHFDGISTLEVATILDWADFFIGWIFIIVKPFLIVILIWSGSYSRLDGNFGTGGLGVPGPDSP